MTLRMGAPRGRCFFDGAHWGAVVPFGRALDKVDDVFDLDAAVAALESDERVVFVEGYDGGSFAWRCRVVDAGDVDHGPAPALTLSTTTTAKERHLARIRRCHELLLDGVLYQANLAHRLTVSPATHAEGLAFYAASPARRRGCAAFVDDGGSGSMISLSPERFVVGDLQAGTVATFPIKGTLPASADPAALSSSEKDQAEHVMIVDLLRNDLGRVARPGTVTVARLMDVVTTPSVHHLESTISARLRPGVGLRALLDATAPGGSITGAPKSAAVEVIKDLEDGPRGAYTGVLGVVDHRGAFVSSLLIRTWMRSDDGDGSLHVGGGIVVDSDPLREWQETLDKAAAFGAVVVTDG